MKFKGFHKLSVIDYPEKLCALGFTGGCNFRCHYCHNPELVNRTATPIPEEEKGKGSNRMVEPNRLIHSNMSNKRKYLNISVDFCIGGRMAEWLLQPLDTRCPSGCVGSIPTPAVKNSNKSILGVN